MSVNICYVINIFVISFRKLDKKRVYGVAPANSKHVTMIFNPIDDITDILASFGSGYNLHTHIVQNVQINANPVYIRRPLNLLCY